MMEIDITNNDIVIFIMSHNLEVIDSNDNFSELMANNHSLMNDIRLHLRDADKDIITFKLKDRPEKRVILFRSSDTLYGFIIEEPGRVSELETKIRETEFLLSKITEERANSTILTVNALKERNLAFEELKKIQDQTQLIIDTVGEGVVMLNADGMINYANPTAKIIL